MKKILIIAWVLVFALQLMPFTASAADAPTQLWVEPSDTNGIPARIDVFEKKEQTGGSYWNPTYTYYNLLFLPGNAVLSECFLSWDGGATATINGTPYESGACPLPQVGTETTYEFKNGDQSLASLKIIVYQGSPNVQSVFIEIDESYTEEGETEPHTIAAMDGDSEHEKYCVGDVYINGVKYDLTKMKGRGNATWKESDDKKPYNITLGSKINFPGVDSETTKKWSLLAENLDHSLLGNRSGYWLAHELGIGQDTTSADVWMNGEYQGCYTVTPKTDSFVTKNGFMIEQDNYLEGIENGGDPQFQLEGLKEASGWSSCYNRISVKKIGDNLLINSEGDVDETPENQDAVAKNVIKPWLQDAWDAIRSDTGYNSKGKYYTDYIDIESFAKMYLMHEYVKSYDVCAGSILYYRNGTNDTDKLYAGPLWDLDNAMGSTYQNSSLGKADDRNNGDRRSAEGDFIQNVTEYKTSVYKTISKHADFMKEVKYQYTKNQALFDSLPGDFDAMSSSIEASALMNHIKVNDLGHGTGKDNHYYNTQTALGTSPYQQTYVAISNSKTDWPKYVQNMKTYITCRSLWFRNNYVYPDYVDPADCTHEYEVIENHPASCTRSGSITYKCPHCRDTYTEVLAQFPHDYQDGVCTVCRETLLDVSISCAGGASVTVYETKGMTGPCIENATLVHPRNSDTGLIDCAGDGQVNFVVNPLAGYLLESVTAEPAASYKNLKLPADTGVENGYRLTKVNGNLTITIRVSGSLTFNPNGGGGTMETERIYLGEEKELPESGFTRVGYTFDGWNTRADGTGTAYADKAKVNLTENTVLYAQWKVDQHTITFDTAGGNEIAAITADYGTVVTAPADPMRTGYTFDGWDKAIPSTMPAENITITAQWTINRYTVTFNTAGGSAIEAQTMTYLEKAARPEDPTKEGCKFLNWADKDGLPFNFETPIKDNVELTAVWHEHQPGQSVHENEAAATCTEAGSYDAVVRCTECHEELSRTPVSIPALGHTAADAVIENRVEPTANAEGSYDEVVYCAVCHDELSRIHKTIDKLPAPIVPELVSATAGSGQITVKWNGVTNATKYAVYRKTAGGSWKCIKSTVTDTTYTDSSTDLAAGTTYYYTVKAYVNGAWSGYDKAGVSATALASTTPALVSATASAGQIKVAWNAVSGASKYAVYRKTAGGSWKCINSAVTGTTYTDSSTDLAAGTTYYYTVKAYVNGAWSGYDKAGVSATALASTTPALVSATASAGQIKVTWNAVSGASKYAVYRKTAGGSWKCINSAVTGTTYTDSSTDLAAGTTYYYTVKAYVNSAWSGYDKAGVSATAAAASSTAPVLVSAAASAGQITVKWNAVTNAAKYAVYRKTAGGNWKCINSAVTGTTYTDSSADLVAGTTYYYTVKAYVGGAWSDYDKAGVSATA